MRLVASLSRGLVLRWKCFLGVWAFNRALPFFTTRLLHVVQGAGGMTVRTVGVDIASLLPKPKGPSSRYTPASAVRSRPLELSEKAGAKESFSEAMGS